MNNKTQTPWAVLCTGEPPEIPGCGKVYLTKEEYLKQLSQPNKTWRCPNCRQEASWDDDNYEQFLDAEGKVYDGNI